ncbi:MAG: SDR family oxidoreductase [Clostridia bacterium]|nr:SDR family oxidoreductase [Clostridia bacterium]
MQSALITGASSGIGREIARILSEKGYYTILIGRNEKGLEETLHSLKNDGEIYVCDLSKPENIEALYAKYPQIDILVNNAGFGVFGPFAETDLKKEQLMIATNITALHTLTKLYLPGMLAQKRGYILNVASLAGFMSGPLMASYYATKSYVLRLSRAISKEIKGSGVSVTCLCPGPVDTGFNDVAGVHFALKPLTAEKVARCGVRKMFKKSFICLPGITAKLTAFVSKFLPDSFLSSCSYAIQKKKI